MICTHNTVTNVTTNDKYVLVHCGDDLIMAKFTGGETSSSHNVEVFDTAQEIIDRGLELGLTCSVDHMLTAMEHGAILPQDSLDKLHLVVWDMDIDYINRMKALGYTQP
jgi:hypothetical protein